MPKEIFLSADRGNTEADQDYLVAIPGHNRRGNRKMGTSICLKNAFWNYFLLDPPLENNFEWIFSRKQFSPCHAPSTASNLGTRAPMYASVTNHTHLESRSVSSLVSAALDAFTDALALRVWRAFLIVSAFNTVAGI